jgi:protease IV
MDNTPQSSGYPQQPLSAQIVQPRPRGFPFARLLAFFLAFLLVMSVLVNVGLLGMLGLSSAESENRVLEKYYSMNKNAPDKIAIISVEGTIITGEGFIKRQIDHAIKEAKEGTLKAVVLNVDSPGGTMTGSDYIYQQLLKLKATGIPIVVSMGGLAASGGYYVSMAVGDTPKSIFAEPTTWTGSIGVIMPHYDISDLLGKVGVKEDSVASHPLKSMGSLTRPMTEKEREIFQGLITDAFDRFKSVVREGRPFFKHNPKALDDLATGQVYTAEQAKKNNLIDEIGTDEICALDKAIDRAIELTRLSKDNVCVVKYKQELTLASALLGVETRSKPAFDLSALLESTAPRAYYLYSWMPVVASSNKE